MNSLTAESLIRKWQKNLNLMHWTFGISTQKPAPGHQMEIAMTPTRQHAGLRIADDCWEYSEEKFEKLIIHELLHPLFQPIETEAERIINPFKGTHKYHKRAVETTVDHLANVLYSLRN